MPYYPSFDDPLVAVIQSVVSLLALCLITVESGGPVGDVLQMSYLHIQLGMRAIPHPPEPLTLRAAEQPIMPHHLGLQSGVGQIDGSESRGALFEATRKV